MKKIGILLAITILIIFQVKSIAQKDRKLSKGLSINFIIGFPSDSYAYKNSNTPDEYKFNKIWGIKTGSRWYFSPSDKFGIGLMVNWSDVVFGYNIKNDWEIYSMETSMFELGPVATIAISQNIAIDGYYNLRPTAYLKMVSLANAEEPTVYFGYGFSHAIGGAIRWKAFNVGLEYVIGTIKCSVQTPTITLDDENANLNSLRLLVGFKF
jgi:hypothetical protein